MKRTSELIRLKVAPADLQPPKMLQDGRMDGLVKLRRSARSQGERRLWAEAVWKRAGKTYLMLVSRTARF